MPQSKKFLFVLTSTDELGDSGQPTGFHFSEMSDPYYLLSDSGVSIDLATVNGGNPSADPGSVNYEQRSENADSVNRFLDDVQALDKLKNTIPLHSINVDTYDGIYIPGGHGCMWDLAESHTLADLVTEFWEKDKIVSAVCHGPAGLINAKNKNGEPLVKGLQVNSFTDAEEREVQKDEFMPFMLESKLRELGANFKGAGLFEGISVRDGNLITGQNPPSAPKLAHTILDALGLEAKKKAA